MSSVTVLTFPGAESPHWGCVRGRWQGDYMDQSAESG